ncbi:hypothetical protein BKI52_06630 [marine bacterium AO1-C]|nr:hypothetical protein BKI52_06630 [marine bacterium AO1-C]
MMSVWLFYLLKASVCMAVFYAFYRVVLSKSSFHQWNRVFLLGAIAASLAIPLLTLPYWQANEPMRYSRDLVWQTQNLLNDSANTNKTTNKPSLVLILLSVVYGVGVLVAGFRFLQNLRKVRALIRSHHQQPNGKFIWIETNTVPTSSFFHYIFINRKNLSEEELAQVIRHEQAHSKAWHSFDIMFLCVLNILFWFNPLIHIIRKTIEELHEYMVDAIVVQHSSIPQYSRLLLQLATKPSAIQLTSSFAKIQLKKRIIMLNKTKTNHMKKLKFLFAAPLAVCLIAIFASASQAQQRADLIGQWKGVDVVAKALKPDATMNPMVFTQNKELHQASSYQLKKDGFFTMKNPVSNESGKWQLSGDYLQIGNEKMKVTKLANGQLSLVVYVSLKTGKAAKDKASADFELTYKYAKK